MSITLAPMVYLCQGWYPIYGMKKTTVYLSNEEAEGLRRVAIATGRSQAELIRTGIRHVLSAEEATPCTFHSLGKGRGGGDAYFPWDADDLYGTIMGQQ